MVESMRQARDLLYQTAHQLQPLALKALDYGFWAIRLDALRVIVFCLLAIFIAMILLGYARRWLTKARINAQLYESYRQDYKGPEPDNDGEEMLIGGSIAMGASLAITIAALFQLCDVWIWVALFRPDIQLAHEIIQKTLGQ